MLRQPFIQTSGPGPHSTPGVLQHLEDILADLRNTWAHSFLFTPDPIHIPYFTSDSFINTSLIGERVDADLQSFTSSEQNDTGSCRFQVRTFMIPAMAVHPFIAGFGVNHRPSLLSDPPRVPSELHIPFRFILNTITQSLVLVSDCGEELDSAMLFEIHESASGELLETRAIFERKNFLSSAWEDPNLPLMTFVSSLMMFSRNTSYRLCTNCSKPVTFALPTEPVSPLGFCTCEMFDRSPLMQFPLKVPTHPFDFSSLRSVLQNRIGAFHDMSRTIVFSSSRPIHCFNHSSVYTIQGNTDQRLAHAARKVALTNFVQMGQQNPRVDFRLNVSQMLQTMLKSRYGNGWYDLSDGTEWGSGSDISKGIGSFEDTTGQYGREMCVPISQRVNKLFDALISPLHGSDGFMANKHSPRTISRQSRCEIVCHESRLPQRNNMAHSFMEVGTLSTCGGRKDKRSGFCQRRRSVNGRGRCEGEGEGEREGEGESHDRCSEGYSGESWSQQNFSQGVAKVVEDGAEEYVSKSEEEGLKDLGSEKRREYDEGFGQKDGVMSEWQKMEGQISDGETQNDTDVMDEWERNRYDAKTYLNAPPGETAEEQTKRRQIILKLRRERNRLSARRSNARIKAAREALAQQVEEARNRVTLLRSQEMKLRLENLQLRKRILL